MKATRDPAQTHKHKSLALEMVAQAHGIQLPTDAAEPAHEPARPGESSTPQPAPAPPPPLREAATVAEEPQVEDRIPRDRFDDVISERNRLREEANALRAEREAERQKLEREVVDLKEQLGRDAGLRKLEEILAPQNLPAGWDEMSETDRLRHAMRETAKATISQMAGATDQKALQRVLLKDRLLAELGKAMTPKQADALAKIAERYQNMPARHVEILAQTEHPELFHVEQAAAPETKAEAPASAQVPASHRTAQPAPSRKTEKKVTPTEDAQKAFLAARRNNDRDGMELSLGKYVAHELIAPALAARNRVHVPDATNGPPDRLIVKSTRVRGGTPH